MDERSSSISEQSRREHSAQSWLIGVSAFCLVVVLTVGFVRARGRMEHMQRQLDRIEREVRK